MYENLQARICTSILLLPRNPAEYPLGLGLAAALPCHVALPSRGSHGQKKVCAGQPGQAGELGRHSGCRGCASTRPHITARSPPAPRALSLPALPLRIAPVQDMHRVPQWYQIWLMNYQSLMQRYIIEDRFSGELTT